MKDEPGYINRIAGATPHRDSLLAELRAYRPYADLVSEIRILLLGPVGSGKSSFQFSEVHFPRPFDSPGHSGL